MKQVVKAVAGGADAQKKVEKKEAIPTIGKVKEKVVSATDNKNLKRKAGESVDAASPTSSKFIKVSFISLLYFLSKMELG